MAEAQYQNVTDSQKVKVFFYFYLPATFSFKGETKRGGIGKVFSAACSPTPGHLIWKNKRDIAL